jgi:hypothetical protein
MTIRRFIAALLVAMLVFPNMAAAQAGGDVWRVFAQKLEAGAPIVVRLENGQRFKATLIEARPDALLLQPKTRRPVPVQPVSYDAIQLLERENRNGMGAAKAAAIGVATGAGAFLAVLAIIAATVGD